MRLQFDIAAMVLRQEDGKLTIQEAEYEGTVGKVIACTVNPDERTVTYFLEDYDEAKHGAFGEPIEPTDEEVLAEVVEQVAEANA
jgi:hypothetical protein